MTIRPAEAVIVSEIFERVIAGEALRGIATDLTARGVPTATGGRWNPVQVRRIASNPRYCGLRARRTGDSTYEVVAPATWPPIVPEDTWRRSYAVIHTPGRGHGKPLARKHLLSGVLTCSECGTRLRSHYTKGQLA